LLEIFRRAANSWQVVLNTINVTWDIPDDGLFSALPQYGTNPNASENSRRCVYAVNGTLRTWVMGNGNNTLDDNLVFQLRKNNLDVVGVTITIPPAAVAIFTLENIVESFLIGDTFSFRGDFDDPADTGATAFNNSGAGGT